MARVEIVQESGEVADPLNDLERVQLRKNEDIIKKGFATFLAVGLALSEIRDNRLYRETHDRWEDYCKAVWDFSKRYADFQIQAYETVSLLESKREQLFPFLSSNPEPIPEESTRICSSCKYKKGMANRKYKGVRIPGESGKCTRPGGLCEKKTGSDSAVEIEADGIPLPINEAQTRPMNKLSPDEKLKAWGLVLQWLNEGKKLTSGLVGKAAKEVKGETRKENVVKAKTAVDTTELVSKRFKVQFQAMLDVISEEQQTGWKTTSQKEAVKWLENLKKIAEED